MKRNQSADARLADVALFSACTPEELALIGSKITQINVKAGDVLASEGRAGHEFVVIEEGQAKVRIGSHDVATLGPGDFFGEVALLDDGPRTATVVAETDVVADVIGHSEFDELVTSVPQLAKRLLVGLARRLRAADVQLTG